MSTSRRLPLTSLNVLLGMALAACGADPGVEVEEHDSIEKETETVTQAATVGKYGFLWANEPKTRDYEPDWQYSYNSAGYANRVVRNGTGSYTATMPGVGSAGVPLVTAYGNGNARCKAASWGGTTNLGVNVICHSTAGISVDSAFVVTYFEPGKDDVGAHVFASRSTTDSYIPSRQWSSTTAQSTVLKKGTGRYQVQLPFHRAGGNVQVSAHGGNTNYCKVESWYPFNSSHLFVDVRCFNTAGNAANTAFVMAFNRNIPLPSRAGAYAWASDPGAAEYSPPVGWSLNTPGHFNRAYRSGQGIYSMLHAAVPDRVGAVNVTAYGAGSEYCKVQSWGWDGTVGGTRVQVRCFSATGDPVDTQYSERFLDRGPP